MSLLDGVKSILLDIEGTTTPIDFVHDVLFAYARDHVRDFLTDNFDSAEVRADIALLREEHEVDVRENRNPPPLAGDIESITTYVKWLIACDRKSTGLKSLQGKIWQQGYLAGVLKSQVFADVRPALERWRARGLSISIFSSGSVLAQRLLFAHTDAGDLTRFIDNYFDTQVGKKGEANSYRRIAEALNLHPGEILFISDVITELDAAREAGMKTLFCIRPSNPSTNNATQHPAILNFDNIN